MAYRNDASASERWVLDGLRERGITWVTVGQLRGWYRKGVPKLPEQVADFARLVQALGPRHTDHALLVLAGARPELVDAQKAAAAFRAWFERQFGRAATDPDRGAKTLYFRMSRSGGVRRRTEQLPRLGARIECDLRAAGYPIDGDRRMWTSSPVVQPRFSTEGFLRVWAAQLPGARAKLRESTPDELLAALRRGYLRAAFALRREDTPLHALDVLLEQDAQRLMTKSEVLAQLRRLA